MIGDSILIMSEGINVDGMVALKLLWWGINIVESFTKSFDSIS
jgi:hypothetical protein